MKKFLTVFLATLIMMIANLASADIPTPYTEIRGAMALKYDNNKSLIKKSLNFTLLDNNIISMNFKLPEKCDYNCVIYSNESPLLYGSVSYNPYSRRYRNRYQGSSDPSEMFPSPSNEDIIKKFTGNYNGSNDITETFEYKTPEKKDNQKIPVSDYLLKIEYRITHKETTFGPKKLENPLTETFWYKISVKQEDEKISVEVS